MTISILPKKGQSDIKINMFYQPVVYLFKHKALFRSKKKPKNLKMFTVPSQRFLPENCLCFELPSFSFSISLQVDLIADFFALDPEEPPRYFLVLPTTEVPSKATGSSVVLRRLERIQECVLLKRNKMNEK